MRNGLLFFTYFVFAIISCSSHKTKNGNNKEISELFVQTNIDTTFSRTLYLDTLVTFNTKNYHLTIKQTPLRQSVIKIKAYGENKEFINYYADNILDITIEQGVIINNILVTKEDFKTGLPKDFFERAILDGFDFINLNSIGFIIRLSTMVPDSDYSFGIMLTIAYDGKKTFVIEDSID